MIKVMIKVKKLYAKLLKELKENQLFLYIIILLQLVLFGDLLLDLKLKALELMVRWILMKFIIYCHQI